MPHDKSIVSCSLCRRRKVRCDRKEPCGTCSRRGLARSCTYNSSHEEVILPKSAGTVHERIHQLEKLVISLMENVANSSASVPVSTSPRNLIDRSASTEIPMTTDEGYMRLSNSGAISYVGASHWSTVLDSIIDLKDHLNQGEDSQDLLEDNRFESNALTSPLLYSSVDVTEEQILKSIPSRDTTDRLVARYFSLESTPGILHGGQFILEYEKFWGAPSETSLIWVGLLFTVLCLGSLVQDLSQAQASRTTDPILLTFRERVVQCLILSKYTKGGPHVLETLVQYYMIEHYLRQDVDFEIWTLHGIIIPITFRMGLHRDPKHFKNISPFAGEMRRRIWATVFQIDVCLSSFAGLPRMIKPHHCDTEEPRHLWDSDIDKDTFELPQSRPESEVTPISYLLAKHRILSVGGIVGDLASNVTSYPFTERKKVEKLLRDTLLTIPPYLQWQRMSAIHSPQIFLQRLYLEISFHRYLIMLYKKYLSTHGDQYKNARAVALDSALKLLGFQQKLDEEIKIDSRLSSTIWTYSSILNHDFMLATSVLCFCLKAGNDTSQFHEGQYLKIVPLLRTSYDIWLESSRVSNNAQKAVKSISVILGIPSPGEEEATQFPLEENVDSLQFNEYLSWSDYEHYQDLNMLDGETRLPQLAGNEDVAPFLDPTSFFIS